MTEQARLELVIDASKAKVGSENLTKTMDGLLTVTGKVTVSLDGVDKRLDLIAASTRSTAQGTEIMTRGLSAVALNGQKSNEILERLAREISVVSAQTKENSRQTLELARAQAVAEASTNDLNRSMRTLGASAKAVSDVYVGADGLIHRFGGVNKAAGELTATSATNAVATKGLARSIDDLSRSASIVRGPLSGLVTGLSGILVLRDAGKTISGFEASIATLRGVTGLGANSATLKDLTEQARELGATTRFTAQEAAEGQVVLARAGFQAREVLAAMPSVLNLAAAGNIDLATSTDISANAVRQFNLDASETGRVVDSILNTSNNSNTGIVDLGEALKFAGNIATDFNADIEETNALLGVLADRGIKGTLAGTGVRGVFARLADPSTEARQVLRGLVGDLDLVDVKSRGIVAVLETLRDAGFDVVDSFQVFGRLQAGPALALIQNIDRVKELVEVQRENAGVTEKVARIQNDTLRGSYLALRSAIEETYLATGDEGLAGALRALTDAGTGALRILNGTAKEAELADAGANALAISLKVVGIAAAGLVTIRLITYLNGVRVALIAVGTAASTNPIGAIATAFVLAGSAVYSFISVLNETVDPFDALDKRVSSLADTLEQLKSSRIDIQIDGKAGDRESLLRAELTAVREARRTILSGGDSSLIPIDQLSSILKSDLSGEESLLGIGDADRIAEATISEIVDSFRVYADKEGFVLTPAGLAAGLFHLKSSVLDVDSEEKAARDKLHVRGTSFVDVVPETPEQKTARGARERQSEFQRILEEVEANGKDFTDIAIVLEAIKESNSKVIRSTRSVADELAKEKQDILSELAEGLEGKANATAAGTVLSADIGELRNRIGEDRARVLGIEKTNLERVNEEIEKYLETAKSKGILDEELATIQAKSIELARKEAKELDDAIAAVKRREAADEARQKGLRERLSKERDFNNLLTAQHRELYLAQFRTSEQRELAVKLTDLGVKATQAGISIMGKETRTILEQLFALNRLTKAREDAKKAAEAAVIGPVNGPIDARETFTPSGSLQDFINDFKTSREEAQRRVQQFLGGFSDEKLFLGADIEAARSGRFEDADLFRDRILAARELNDLLKETGDLETEAGQIARAELDQSINEIASLREELRLVGEERAFFEDLGNAGAEAFTDIAFSAESLRDTIAGLIEDVGRLAFTQLATRPLAGLLTNGLSSLFGGSGIIASARGNAFEGGELIRLAQGGVLSQRTRFPLNERQTVEAGEAGPEGILPLMRDGKGRLGVIVSGGGGSTTTYNSTVNNIRIGGGGGGGRRDTFNRSSRQLASDLVRALQSVR